MGDWFIGEIRLFAFGYVPQDGWMSCDGRLLPIQKNQALYSILGIAFGGDGKTDFALPDLRGTVAVQPQVNNSYPIPMQIQWGKKKGEETHILSATEVPVHSHLVTATSKIGTTAISKNNLWATEAGGKQIYGVFSTTTPAIMNNTAVSIAGGYEAHPNMQPFQVLNYCIATTGIYPPRQ